MFGDRKQIHQLARKRVSRRSEIKKAIQGLRGKYRRLFNTRSNCRIFREESGWLMEKKELKSFQKIVGLFTQTSDLVGL